MKFVNKILIEMLMVVIWTKLKPDEDFQYERLCFEIRSTTFSLQIVFDYLGCAELYCHPPRPQVADGGAASRYRG